MNLQQLYAVLSGEDRRALAIKARTSPAYLWQLATHWRGRRPSVALLARLAAADERLSLPAMVAEFAPQPALQQ